MSSNTSSYSSTSNSASQVGYLDFSNSSNRFCNFLYYTKEVFDRFLIKPDIKISNIETLRAIEDSKKVPREKFFHSIDELFTDLEN